MFHLVGVTPEAATFDAAFGGRVPAPITITRADLDAERVHVFWATTSCRPAFGYALSLSQQHGMQIAEYSASVITQNRPMMIT